jgi:hypothetical protein
LRMMPKSRQIVASNAKRAHVVVEMCVCQKRDYRLQGGNSPLRRGDGEGTRDRHRDGEDFHSGNREEGVTQDWGVMMRTCSRLTLQAKELVHCAPAKTTMVVPVINQGLRDRRSCNARLRSATITIHQDLHECQRYRNKK